ncbi:MAG: DUF1016 N-terminal domain-containing protein [Phycisphaerae bacterium]|nr:DUF1016 N-terminal domain-containing protein [Phycisphaerae bacterium]
MSAPVKPDHYMTLVNDITDLYNRARHAQVEAHWQIGKRIVETEQQDEINAVYGDHLVTHPAKDLSETLGSGFSKRNLYNMRLFYLTHKEIVQPVAQLTWIQELEVQASPKRCRRRRRN